MDIKLKHMYLFLLYIYIVPGAVTPTSSSTSPHSILVTWGLPTECGDDTNVWYELHITSKDTNDDSCAEYILNENGEECEEVNMMVLMSNDCFVVNVFYFFVCRLLCL